MPLGSDPSYTRAARRRAWPSSCPEAGSTALVEGLVVVARVRLDIVVRLRVDLEMAPRGFWQSGHEKSSG